MYQFSRVRLILVGHLQQFQDAFCRPSSATVWQPICHQVAERSTMAMWPQVLIPLLQLKKSTNKVNNSAKCSTQNGNGWQASRQL